MGLGISDQTSFSWPGVELSRDTALIQSDPAASRWLRETLLTALQRDLVDALIDALALVEILESRSRQILELDAARERP
jgi:hypothetical protein